MRMHSVNLASKARLHPRGVLQGLGHSSSATCSTVGARSVHSKAIDSETEIRARQVVQESAHASLSSTDDERSPSTSGRGKLIGSAVTVGGLAALIIGGVVFQDAVKDFIGYFTTIVGDMGPVGVLVYGGVYTGLEVLAVPAIPLTMTAGAIFGIPMGSIVTSFAGTVAATISFLLARYVARDKFVEWASKSRKFRAIDTVIGRDGFKVVALLRLSPLLPLSASNYLYGLTSVSLPAYFFGSWLGMLPGTIAYVSAGHVGKVAFTEGADLPLQWWQVVLAFAVTAGAVGYIGTLAKKALKEIDEQDGSRGDVKALTDK